VGFEQMLRRRHINGHPEGRPRRFASGAVDFARWPFERAAWSLERWVLWPLQRRLASWIPPTRRAGAAGALAAIAVAILAAVLILPGASEPSPEDAGQPTRVAIVPAGKARGQATEPQGPTLRGAMPDFGVGAGVGVAKTTGDAARNGETADSNSPESTSTGSGADSSGEAGSPSAEAAGATASAAKPVPAGPAAMKVARRFSEAFVYYEIGKRPARAETVFGETASPQLAEALGERPPRQPAGGSVPKAKVLNLVPGPRAGKAYTVSVSLLRVGLTSELRLELSKQKGQWLVTDVRG
jgi:hypothetical protein